MGDSGDRSDVGDISRDVPVAAITEAAGEIYCRCAVMYLIEVEQAELNDLAEAVTKWLSEHASGVADPSDPDQVAIALHHLHLPRLVDAGIVDYESEGLSVSLVDGPATDAFVEMVRALDHSGPDFDTE